VAKPKEDIVLTQRKYALDILEETSMTEFRTAKSPMNQNQKLIVDQGKPFSNPERYSRLVGKFVYLTINAGFLQDLHIDHWNIVIRILRYIKRVPEQGL